MLELLTWPTPNGTKPSIMLEETGEPYSVRLVDIRAGEQRSSEFTSISPNNKIPALIDHDAVDGRRTVFESGAILIYLAERSGSLLPTTGPLRESAISWLFWSMSGIGPTFGQLLHFASSGDQASAVTAHFATEAVRLVRVLERRLGEASYLAEDYSIADIGAFTWVRFAMPAIRKEAGESLGAIPCVDRWLDEIYGRPAVQRGLRAAKIAIAKAPRSRSEAAGSA